jgi:hypothetical protein
MSYIVVDIGCIECGESSDIIGVFDSREMAEWAVSDWEALGWRGGEHYYEIFDMPALNIAKAAAAGA